jgi:hypothetical protein
MSAKSGKQLTLHLFELLKKVEKIAAKNHLPAVDVIRLGLALGLPQIAKRGLLIKPG